MDYIIRRTTDEDLPGILELVHEFHDESLNEYGIFCNDEVANKIMPGMVETSLVMVADDKVVGVIAGFVTNHIVDDKKLFQEVIFYVSKEHRGHGKLLLDAMEKWCKEIGCEHMIMVLLGNLNADIMDSWYKRRGYKKLEVQYIRNL